MHRPAEYFVPVADVQCIRSDEETVLAGASSDEHITLTETGRDVWMLLQGKRRTIDRLVMALARRSSGQALALIPDLVREELDLFVSRGFVRRIAV
jgi:hypothetical protein